MTHNGFSNHHEKELVAGNVEGHTNGIHANDDEAKNQSKFDILWNTKSKLYIAYKSLSP